MVVIGTKQEYFNAVWVKNEWSRYLSLIKKDRRKLLIPCYSDIDVYDLPEELSMFQSQDMTKIGFIQDLIRGIKKVLSANEDKTDSRLQSNSEISYLTPGVTQLLERTSLFLEDGNFQSAQEYCDRILDLEPRNAYAYFYKLLALLKLHCSEDIITHTESLDGYLDYQKAVRFADESYKKTIQEYNKKINDRLETERIESTYQRGLSRLQRAETEQDYLELIQLFDGLNGYKDSSEKADISRGFANEKLLERQREEEKARLEKEEKERLEQEYTTVINELWDEVRKLEKTNMKLNVLQWGKRSKIENELVILYEQIRQTKAKYGKDS